MTHANSDTYESLVYGQYSASQVVASFKNKAQALSPREMDAIEVEWNRQCDVVQKDGRTLFNGEMLRLDSHVARDVTGKGTTLALSLSKTSYKNFVGTNMALFRDDVRIAPEHLANPLGLSALVICSDAKILLGLRGKGTFLYSGYWHTFGGTADLGDVGEDGSVSVFDVMARELEEELGITDEETSQLRCIGLVRDRFILQPELIFEARVALSSIEVAQRLHGAHPQSSDEHDRLMTVDDTTEAAGRFSDAHGMNTTPVARAALAHHFAVTAPSTARGR